jgi:hypothetical protein
LRVAAQAFQELPVLLDGPVPFIGQSHLRMGLFPNKLFFNPHQPGFL